MSAAQNAYGGRKKRVLIIDDDHETRVSLRNILEDNNIEVYSATNGADALVKMHQLTRADFIILDINMPIMNGDEFLAIVKRDKEWESVPVIQVSAANNPKREDASFSLQKPFDLDKLLALIEGAPTEESSPKSAEGESNTATAFAASPA